MKKIKLFTLLMLLECTMGVHSEIITINIGEDLDPRCWNTPFGEIVNEENTYMGITFLWSGGNEWDGFNTTSLQFSGNGGALTISTSTGEITSVVFEYEDQFESFEELSSDWSDNSSTLTYSGSPASTVTLSAESGDCSTITRVIISVDGYVSPLPNPDTYPFVDAQNKLPGAFSVSSTKQVWFSKGNLQYQASTGTWRFAEFESTYIGRAEGNTTETSQRSTQSDWIDLFGWGASGWDNTANDATSVHYQPWENCGTEHGYTGNRYGYGPSNANVGAGESWSKSSSYQNYDWGVYNAGQLGDGWRVPTSEEWVYMFNTRSASTVNGTANARFAVAKLFGIIRGVIIFPDSYTHPDGVPQPININVDDGFDHNNCWEGNQYTVAQWAAMEAAGAVFLPAAGYRNQIYINTAGYSGSYWSSTVGTYSYTVDATAYCLYFSEYMLDADGEQPRHYGHSVRLVSEIAPPPAATVTSAPTAVSTTPFTYNGGSKTVFNMSGSASGGTMMYQVTTTNTKPGKNEGTWSTWDNSIRNHTDAGTYYLWYYVEGDVDHSDSEVFGPVTKEIEKRTAQVATAPSSKAGMYWTGSAQALFNAGTASYTGTTMMYTITTSGSKPAKGDVVWTTTIPERTDIGTYWLWYYVAGDANHNDSEVSTANIQNSILKIYPTVTAPTRKTIPYDGNEHELVVAGSTNIGDLEYSVNGGDWSTTVPSATVIGNYTVSYRVNFTDTEHYNNHGPYSVTSSIAAPIASITTAGDVTTLYTDYNNDLINAWVDGSTLKLLQSFDIATCFSLQNKGNITLDLNGCGIRYTYSQTYPLYELKNTTSLTIIDSNPTTEHKFSKGEYENYASLNEASGTIIINGGYITGAKASAIKVTDENASLTMNGGTLIGNYTSNDGGAVTVEEGLFTMNGGAINYNYAGYNGGGVMLVTGTDYSRPSFVMNGGSITHNLVGNQGGGVCTRLYTNFTLNKTGVTNPEIRYNTHTYDPEPKNDNVYVALNYGNYGDVRINIGSGLDRTQHDMVGINVNPSNLDEVFTSGLGASGNDYEKYFFGDIPYYPVQEYGTEARLHYEKYRLQVTAPVAAATETYDGYSYAMLSTYATTDGPADVKYTYKFKRHGGSYGSWSEYSTSLPTVTEAGVYQIKAKAFTTDNTHYYDSYESDAVTFTILRADIEYVAEPQAVTGLVYTGTPRELVTIAENALRIAGSAQSIDGSSTMLHYSVACAASNPGCEAQGWVPGQLPNALNPGCYDVTYWVPISDNYNQIGEQHIDNICIADPDYAITWDDEHDKTTEMHSLSGHVVSDLTISRTISQKGEYNTICLPISLSAAEIAACELNKFIIQEFTGVSVVGANGSLMKVNVRNVSSIEAGKPYFARYDTLTYGHAASDYIYSLHITDAHVGAYQPNNVVTTHADFIGTLKPTDFPNNNTSYLFVAANNTLKWSTTGNPIKGFRAYFHMKTANQAASPVRYGMPARIAEQTDETTELENIVIYEEQNSAQKVLHNGQIYILRGDNMYTIDGQFVK